MAAQSEDNDSSKKKRKDALKAKAVELGISYKDLKAQKKAVKQVKMTRETEALQDPTEKKRMRSWSKDLTEPEAADDNASKRRRTRSMDAKENNVAKSSSSPSAEEWRKERSITVKGHGKYEGQAQSSFENPFFTFKECPFVDKVQKVFEKLGYEKPSEIQAQAWPIAIKGHDMICVAKTGSGKTCGFLIPAIHQHFGNNTFRSGRNPMLLVLAPTRELACQIKDEISKFSGPMGFAATCCYGGAPKWGQISIIRRGVDCIVGTPGRINDLLTGGQLKLNEVKFCVLDEADRMLDMGFEPQIRSIVECLPTKRQTLLFSATWPREIQKLAHDFLTDPIQVNVGDVNSLNANKDVKQNIIMCSPNEKVTKLHEILKELTDQGVSDKEKSAGDILGAKKHAKIIIFTSRKVSCGHLANQLWDDGFAVDCLHGDRAQWERTKVMNAFKSGVLRMLIATDVASRGLDVKDVGVVVNFDMPTGTNAVEDYVHRIGRTGRAGATGVSYSFFTQQDSKCANQLVDVMRKAEQIIPPELQAMVTRRGFGRGGGRGGGRGRGRGRGGNRQRYGGGGGGRGYM